MSGGAGQVEQINDLLKTMLGGFGPGGTVLLVGALGFVTYLWWTRKSEARVAWETAILAKDLQIRELRSAVAYERFNALQARGKSVAEIREQFAITGLNAEIKD